MDSRQTHTCIHKHMYTYMPIHTNIDTHIFSLLCYFPPSLWRPAILSFSQTTSELLWLMSLWMGKRFQTSPGSLAAILAEGTDNSGFEERQNFPRSTSWLAKLSATHRSRVCFFKDHSGRQRGRGTVSTEFPLQKWLKEHTLTVLLPPLKSHHLQCKLLGR